MFFLSFVRSVDVGHLDMPSTLTFRLREGVTGIVNVTAYNVTCQVIPREITA